MPQMPETDDEPQELADKHDGTTVDRQSISGTFEYEVVVDDETVDTLPDRMSVVEFAENVAVSRFNREIDPTFRVDSNDAMGKEEQDWACNGEHRITVWVRFDKNE